MELLMTIAVTFFAGMGAGLGLFNFRITIAKTAYLVNLPFLEKRF